MIQANENFNGSNKRVVMSEQQVDSSRAFDEVIDAGPIITPAPEIYREELLVKAHELAETYRQRTSIVKIALQD